MTLDDLYRRPLEEFIGARDALARELRQRGDLAEAEAVRALRKPSVPIWAINQLARAQGKKLRQLIKEEDALRSAHGASGDRFRYALAAERQTAAELVQDAARILADSGRPATEATLERIASTLQAAAADPAHREELEQGRLTEELEPLGFEALAGVKLPKRPAKRRGKTDARSPERAVEGVRKELAAARDEVRHLEKEAERAEREARDARGRAEKARAEVDRLEKQVPSRRGT
jgi:hypothetical protein